MNDDPEVPENEGVRIIGADEAAEALEREDVAQRRAEGTPGFGDRPQAPPEDAPRPAIRFPLSTDEELEPLGQTQPAPPPRQGDDTALPHWTDPPTGDVPRIFGADEAGDEDDLEAWSSFTASQPRWRGEGGTAHDQEEWDDFSRLADEETRVGALAGEQAGHPDDFFSFDDEYEEQAPVATGGRRRRAFADETYGDAGLGGEPPEPGPAAPPPPGRPRPGGYQRPPDAGRDLPLAIGVGVALAGLFLVFLSIGPAITVGLIAAVLALGAVELLNVLRQAGYQPAVLLGIASCTALPLAAYYKGDVAIPVVLALTVVFGLIWYVAGAAGDDRPVIGLSSTLLGVCYVGVLGSFAALMLTLEGPGEPGTGVLLTAVIGAAAYDIGGFFVGRNAGTRPLTALSPNKTFEGLIGGMAIAGVATLIVASMNGAWTGGFSDALLLAVAVAVVAPLGDLAESMLKRDLDVKDMGAILPGHGGLLYRFDALLFVLPTVYYLALILLY
ncbi:MAG: phosphatidate cytidylyltransferase [Acidimicrobiales bacterium]